MSDTARRLAKEKYPDLPDREFVGDGDQSTTRAAFLAGWEARGAISEEMVEAMATAFAQSIHGEDADQQDADYYAEHLRAALGGEGR